MLLKLDALVRKYNMNIRGVIHVGAHTGEEYADYLDVGVVDVVFIEPLLECFQELELKFKDNKNVRLINKAAGSLKHEARIYKSTNQLASSSLLKPKQHLEQHPDVNFYYDDTIVKVDRLDNMLSPDDDHNFLNLDIQGYELEALRGLGNIIHDIDYVLCEVNRKEVYEECAQVEEIDDFLAEFNFQRTETNWAGDSWGDAFYIRKSLL
jgi:FkbM family methyltransferase|tara:strand:- start:1489 stop:2115 length:627 start_codon:yes stop_codon:yes gene_type:complete